jgi:hypothetical protein
LVASVVADVYALVQVADKVDLARPNARQYYHLIDRETQVKYMAIKIAEGTLK